ncbi:AGE family epimerase/isomerase [Kaistia defluvii]|uniref:AGE family epimerase/isomerase n=1 Tax=Kaistia defluvii TaxID=410841 RepID=UPI00225714D0|nr:AGE family epimerase/isomerase [Kaistia defluvii]MCX5520254.1 AGE family epimerase/isomerase [Kaistia defluvii]
MKSLDYARAWATEAALPLWAETGFDRQRGLFHERLDFERRPIILPASRLMVQARQIATFSRASLKGWHKGADEAVVTCLANVERLYHRGDGHPGWIFSIDADGKPASRVRDLYAHAFIVYALAWSHRLTGDPHAIRLADETLAEIDVVLAAPHGGFLDATPSADPTRRQNPHMHLLEAVLALYETTGRARDFARADALVKLALDRMIDPESGALLEDFSPDWKPLLPRGENRVEPGHQFEWYWLLGEYRRLGGIVPESVTDRVLMFGLDHGLDQETGLIVDAVTDTGSVMIPSFRSWPHAEGVKALVTATREGQPGAAEMADHLMASLLTFAPDSLEGGWMDRIEADGTPLVDHMPASTLYHVMGALFEAEDAANSKTAG